MNGNFTNRSFQNKTNSLFNKAIESHDEVFNQERISMIINVPLEIRFNNRGGISHVENVRILELPISLATKIIESAQKETV